MFLPEAFCCCIDLRCGCICIAILDVIVRGIDTIFMSGLYGDNYHLGMITIVTSGVYLICCIILLIAALLQYRILLLPYIFAALIHLSIRMLEVVYVIIKDSFYDFIIFDIVQAALSLYFTLVVFSYYDTLF